MSVQPRPAQPRPYRQVARAAASQDTRRRILGAFADALQQRWMDEITLDDVAETAGTTRQTVIRLFGGKEGLLTAVAEQIGQEVAIRRSLPPGPRPAAAARAILQDYEVSGDTVFRLLAQEGRHPVLSSLLNIGRREHRQWVREVFAPDLAVRPAAEAEALLDQLVLATDAYTWKLLRRDMRHPPERVEALITDLITKLLAEGESRHG